MTTNSKILNRLINETSPYLLQHADNPVDWFPWGEEAFEKAKAEQKLIFLSIGYSTCHWCHALAHECFEDESVADLLNQHFVSIKVDKEERPDIDSVYMTVCQALTGSGGWPMSIFITPDQKPFYAGTYYPREIFIDLLQQTNHLWQTNPQSLYDYGDRIVTTLKSQEKRPLSSEGNLIELAVRQFEKSFDIKWGGFGSAPKFPSPHNLLFLMERYQVTGEKSLLSMAEKSLEQLYRGGIFDHIGYGFSRYSTDDQFLAPHFEKMLYDNALLIMAYTKAYALTKKPLYQQAAQQTAQYILREMRDESGGFYAAQDADSNGVEGSYYLFDEQEILSLLGEETGQAFNEYYDITPPGNFEGKSIPNLLKTKEITNQFDSYLPKVYEYRKSRMHLHKDDKILTAWNGLMCAAFAQLYQVFGRQEDLEVAQKNQEFIKNNMLKDGKLYVSYRDGKPSGTGFLDDYASSLYALINLYQATEDPSYLDQALSMCHQTFNKFYDTEQGGFFLYGSDGEQLILRPKETYDNAIPSGNSLMTYNMIALWKITKDPKLEQVIKQQCLFQSTYAGDYPMGHSFYLMALSQFQQGEES